MRRSILRLALLAAAAALVGIPHSSTPQSPPDELAARSLLATNLANTILNPAKAEDYEFFVTASGGVPNIFFVLDTSGSMERLPPDGPGTYGMVAGARPAMPPGPLLSNPGSDNAIDTARTNRVLVGCGLDPVSAATAAFTQNAVVRHIQERRFYPPCGKTHTVGLVGAAYRGHPAPVASGVDYAYEASVCPYYTPSNSQAVWPANKGGFDPDFYNPSPNNSQIKNVLWAKDLVYHDSDYFSDTYERDTGNNARHNFGKGWQATSPPETFPAESASGYATIDQFCDEQGTTALANGQVPATVCKQCLKQAGWYYDGIILDNQDGRFPSLWYTGNYLNFFPPKFVAMRKIVKDVVASQSKVRMALAEFGTSGMALKKEFNPTCAHPDSSFDSNRGSYVNLLNAMNFYGGTPLSLALFDVGRYYHSPSLSWFGNDWEKTGNSWESSDNSNDYAICYSCQTSSVVVLTDGIPNPDDGDTLPGGTASLADSASKYAGDTGTGIRGVSTVDCPQCGIFSGGSDYKNNLSRVAWYLHNYDLRLNSEATKDCKANAGKQALDVYTVGYSTRSLADANTILANAAAAGGGLFVEAENPALLRQGLRSILEDINGRSTSFSVATVSTLQTASGHAVIIPRFEPKSSPFWEGHLYRYELWSEFVNECDPNKPMSKQPNCCQPNGTWDLDCDGQCRSAFLTDAGDYPGHKNPAFVQEGSDGFFYRNDKTDKAACSQAPMCVKAGKACGDIPLTNPTPATPWWDAGAQLKKKKWWDRRVFTVVDSNHDGRIDASDQTIQLDSSSETSARAIAPYLGNHDNRVCNTIANRIETAGDPHTAAAIRQSEVECAQAVVRWVLGADVFNEGKRKRTDSPPWPPPLRSPSLPATNGDPSAIPPVAPNLPDQQQLEDRPFKLGDVFHSSPVDVMPPLPRGGIMCAVGHPQCLSALWRAPTGDEKSDDDDEYDAYVAHYQSRRKLHLVGSNAGLLHAFNGGAWHPNENDPFNDPGPDESKPPYLGFFDRAYPKGDALGTSDPADPGKIWAEELWAFLPPDMISKLPLMFEGEHQLFVDGSAMVRDVWVDGTANGMKSSATTWDDEKQAREYHTVAVVGERRGGTHYFALDVTDATKLVADGGFEFPKFLWIYPQPDDARSLSMGETYTDFLPVPAPVGPVRIKATATKTKTPSFKGTKFHERWIAFLSGGFDQQYVRGRGVHMVDVWTGKTYWDFAYPQNPAAVAANDPRLHLRYPIPATVGMVSWGPESRRENGLGFANAGFFDTATFGDTGGQLWTLRFHAPGELDTNGQVQNWYGARAFQMGGRVAETLGWAHPFFYITANTALPGEYIYRAYLGSGDRFNLLDKHGGYCGPTNIRACAMRGCTVNVELPSNFAGTPELGTRSGSQHEVGKQNLTTSASVSAGGATISAKAKIVVSGCPSVDTGGVSGFTKEVSVLCEPDGSGRWGCERGLDPKFGEDLLLLSNTANVPVTRNWYFSVRIFDDRPNARIPFATDLEAKAYDAARLWIRDDGGGLPTQGGAVTGGFSIMSAKAANPTSTADAFAAGWAIYYDHGPSATVGGKTYTTNAIDERTSSVSGLYGILTWNTTQPVLSETTASSSNSCFKSKCSSAGDEPRLAWHYAAHPLTGKSVLTDEAGKPIRSVPSTSYVPAQGDQPTIFVNQKGQVLVGMTVVNPNKGASSVPSGEPTDAVKDLGYIEVSEQVHACRHFVPTAAQPTPAAGVCR